MDGWLGGLKVKDRIVTGKTREREEKGRGGREVVAPSPESHFRVRRFCFYRLCEILFFFSFSLEFVTFSSWRAIRPRFVIYSTSSVSSPWSPSISKAAYLLAELNFWRKQTNKKKQKNPSSFLLFFLQWLFYNHFNVEFFSTLSFVWFYQHFVFQALNI